MMERYSATDPGDAKLDFTRSTDPLVRFGGSQIRPLLHFNLTAWEALGLPFKIELSYSRDEKMIVASPSKGDNALGSWLVTRYIYAVSAVGFRSRFGIDWPFGQIAPARLSDGSLEIIIPERGEDETLRLRSGDSQDTA
jgi:hypothetical protein